MDRHRDAERLAAEIRNLAWFVRYYRRGRTSAIFAPERRAAILALGRAVAMAFRTCDEYEVLLTAILDGLAPQDPDPRL